MGQPGLAHGLKQAGSALIKAWAKFLPAQLGLDQIKLVCAHHYIEAVTPMLSLGGYVSIGTV